MGRASELLPRKDAPIVVFCRAGGRASKAKAVLELLGYTAVVNGGGLLDVRDLPDEKATAAGDRVLFRPVGLSGPFCDMGEADLAESDENADRLGRQRH